MSEPFNDPSTALPPPAKPGSKIAWGIILLVVGYLVIAIAHPEIRGHKKSSESEHLQLTILGKYIVGVSEFKHDTAPALLTSADAQAKQPQSKLELAIVAAEVDGPKDALRRLNDVQSDAATPDDVKADAQTLTDFYGSDSPHLSDENRDLLVSQYGYFGKLATVYKVADGDPQRQAVLKEARRSAIVYIGFIVLAIVALLIGLVLLIVGIVLVSVRSIHTYFVPDRMGSPAFVGVFAAYLVLYFGFSIVLSLLQHGNASLGEVWMFTPLVFVALGWARFRGVPWDEIFHNIGWHRGRGLLIEIPLGIVGYIAGIPIVALGLVISLVIGHFTGATPSHPITQEVTKLPAWQLYFVAAVWAPVVEETMFRGALFYHMRRRWGWTVSASWVALIFAAIHPQGLSFIPVLGSIAIVLAGIREWRGTLVPSMVAHGLNNATVLTLMLLTM